MNTQQTSTQEKEVSLMISKEVYNSYCNFLQKHRQPKIIDAADLDSALEFIFSNSPKWHEDRQHTLHPEYPKVKYCKQQHFVLTKINNAGDNGSKQFKQGGKILLLEENEKQVYHEFPQFKTEVEKAMPPVIPKDYKSKYDTIHLVLDGPKGMDPCMTYDQQLYGRNNHADIEKVSRKHEQIAFIR